MIENNGFPAAVQPVLDRLSGKWGVTAIGVEINGLDYMVVLALSHSQVPFRLHVDVGSRFPALISATGRLVAAFSSQPWSEIERRFRALRWQDPPAIDAWRKDVEKVRRKGYSLDRGNYISGVTVLAVPVFNQRRELTHTLVAAGVAEQLDNARSLAMAKDMRAEAEQLSALLLSGHNRHGGSHAGRLEGARAAGILRPRRPVVDEEGRRCLGLRLSWPRTSTPTPRGSCTAGC